MLRTSARPRTWGRKAAQTIRSCQQIRCTLSLLTAVANMGAQWLPWQPRRPLAANPQRRPCHKSTDTFWYIRPDVSYKWLQWPHLTPSSGRFFQKVTHRWADHRNQLLVRTGTLKCLAKPNPAAIPSNDWLFFKNPAKEPILVNCTNEVIENESKLPVWTTATLTRLHKWYLISSPWTPIAPQMRPSNLTASGSCNFKEKKDS